MKLHRLHTKQSNRISHRISGFNSTPRQKILIYTAHTKRVAVVVMQYVRINPLIFFCRFCVITNLFPAPFLAHIFYLFTYLNFRLLLFAYHIPSLFLSPGTYCLEIISFSPFIICASNRPPKSGANCLTLARLMITDLDARKKSVFSYSASIS